MGLVVLVGIISCSSTFFVWQFLAVKQTRVGAGMETHGVNNAYGGSSLFL